MTLECYSEILTGTIEGHLFYPDIPGGKSLLQVLNTIVNIFRLTLQEQFDFTVRGIAYKAGQAVPPGYAIGCKSKADALNPAAEKYVFSDICHCFFLACKYNTNRLFWQSYRKLPIQWGEIVINYISVISLKLFENGYNRPLKLSEFIRRRRDL
jgi:hypothetical protein